MSSADISKIVGYELKDRPVTWLKRDLILYALGVGAKETEDDLPFVYDPKFAAFPTYPVVLTFKGDSPELNLFAERMRGDKLPGFPPVDPNRIVHGSQSIEILKPLPLTSGDGWKWKTRYTGISENKSGVVLTTESVLADPQNVPYAKLYSSSFNLGMKITGDKFNKTIAGPPQAKLTPKTKPDWVYEDQTSSSQALVYRLSGDYNPLHIDPAIGQAAGFGGVILHGLSTFGFAARALLKVVGGNKPDALKLFGVRFTSPVKPGDALQTQIWEVGPGPNGTTEVTFVTKNLRTGKDALGGGIAYIVKSPSAKL
ncbi:peroxisomal dehydratase [Rhodocollybia butyracea]|uniref:Peroxisomal dehydratase n=1 Tax=Rhodocollybia butyracea TaxID=206335 RepID=A0A9P5Q8V6_9AGAR|nr:peroxisomal dehydratase [Rhodocollybia butyracea]